jgi:hypothetical protein
VQLANSDIASRKAIVLRKIIELDPGRAVTGTLARQRQRRRSEALIICGVFEHSRPATASMS